MGPTWLPQMRHRGGGHTQPERGCRLIATLKLMGEHAFVPDGIPLKILPEDAGLEGARGGDGDVAVEQVLFCCPPDFPRAQQRSLVCLPSHRPPRRRPAPGAPSRLWRSKMSLKKINNPRT